MRFAVAALAAATVVAAPAAHAGVRTMTFTYRTSAGVPARAYLMLPSWYGPARHPAVPFVISPHGRGVSGRYNLRFWGAIADRGPFVVVSPDGHGRRLPFYSWGWHGQIDDLARMPQLARRGSFWFWARSSGSLAQAFLPDQELLVVSCFLHESARALLDSPTTALVL